MCICVYIYIYLSLSLYIYIYIYIHTYIFDEAPDLGFYFLSENAARGCVSNSDFSYEPSERKKDK